jgi:hypothetical protein
MNRGLKKFKHLLITYTPQQGAGNRLK